MQITKHYENQHWKDKQTNSTANMFQTKEIIKNKPMKIHRSNN